MSTNPIIKTDYPDPDVIRVEDAYYLVSTTMHFLPGGAVLRSYDLKNWEIISYLFDELEDTPEERLEGERTNYGQGMWAPCLRYRDGVFYAVFGAHGANQTFVFTARDPEGPWEKRVIEGYYHDCSLLFDTDGRVYLVYGNREIRIREMLPDVSGFLEGGLERVLVTDKDDVGLAYEGSHIYRIGDTYYLFLIHWPKSAPAIRTQACFASDSLEGEFRGGDVLRDDMGYHGQGVAQGGLVETPGGKWYAMLFQDSGAVGRMPVLVPVHFENGMPVFGAGGHAPRELELPSSRPYYRYEPLYTSDRFVYPGDGKPQVLAKQWQWNHRPDPRFWNLRRGDGLELRTGKLSGNLTHAVNTLTQRMMWPGCAAEVTVDASRIQEGDFAGLCALQGCYVMLGITKELGYYYLVQIARRAEDGGVRSFGEADFLPGTLLEKIRLDDYRVRMRLSADFADMADTVELAFQEEGKRWKKFGVPHRLHFGLDHFCGARFGLYYYSTKKSGGTAAFENFRYVYCEEE